MFGIKLMSNTNFLTPNCLTVVDDNLFCNVNKIFNQLYQNLVTN